MEEFEHHSGRLLGKIHHFFDVYEAHFVRFRGGPVRMLEIGVDGGGSLELWQRYLGGAAQIHGIDLNPAAKANAPEGSTVHIGSQGDADFLRSVAREHGPFDIVLDDGSHEMDDQILSFETLYPTMSDRGLYVCEDAFTSYWREYGGELGGRHTFMEFVKRRVDDLHAYWAMDANVEPTEFTRTTRAIHVYSGTVLFQRHPVEVPVYAIRCQGERHDMSIAALKAAAARRS
jgi:hypothetical protein